MDSNELHAWMERYQFTVGELAAALGMNERSVRRYRSGNVPISRSIELALQALEGQPREGGRT